MTQEAAELLVEDVGAVRVLRINRPESLNAMPPSLVARLVDAIEQAEQEGTFRCVVIGGVGPHFSSGYDLGGLGSLKVGAARPGIVDDLQRTRRISNQWRRIWECGLPVIAAVRGYCLAGGTDLALHCDLIVCGRGARFGYPAVRHLGVPPTNLWTERIGMSWAKRLLFTGDLLGAQTAARLGLVIDVVDDEAVDDAALTLAQRMALIDRELLMANKISLNLGADAENRVVRQQIAAVMDAVGHRSAGAEEFWQRASDLGLRDTLKERNAPFGRGDPL
jgi:enoyl-CoA hydratase